jgi:hypothetical protein
MNQADFARALFDPALPVPPGWGTRQGGDATARMNVYRNNVVFTLVQALRDTFPALAAWVGRAQFDAWALDFVRAHPPTHPVLTFYGAAFPSALAQALDEPQAHLADLARLEFARIEAFHAQDDAPMAPAVLAALLSDPERLAQVRLPLCAGVTVISASGPIFDLWAAQQDTTDSAALAVRTEGQNVLVAREGWDVVVLRIDAASAQFYAQLQAGHTLAQAMDEAFNASLEFDPSTALALLLRQGCIRAPNGPLFNF